MGGRGGSSKRGGGGGGGHQSWAKVNTKFTTKQLNSMTRKQLESVARAVFIKQNPHLSPSEADYRARSMMSGNSDSQLKKYIKRRG